MNGLGRLRALGAMFERMAAERATVRVDGKPLWMMLLDIAGQIEREQEERGRSMLPRLMPEGMEWPRFEDGEPVRIGDEVTVTVHDEDGDFDRTLAIRSIKYKEDGVLLEGIKNEMVILCHSERVKRPAPKVLDADGVEIRVGDTVYALCDGTEHVVEGIEGGNIKAEGMTHLVADKITHRAPVLASDGKPLREGETVYKVGGDGTPYVFDGMSDNVDGLAMLHHDDKPYVATGLRAYLLTHEQPDNWDRLIDDAVTLDNLLSEYEAEPRIRVEKLVLRAKALAERDAG